MPVRTPQIRRGANACHPAPEGTSPDTLVGGQNLDGDAPVTDSPDAITDNTSEFEETELERTLGLAGGLSIGISTMIGAGMFVFPGLAADAAGPIVAGSIPIGGVIAMLVALPASELATAMPRSGGGTF